MAKSFKDASGAEIAAEIARLAQYRRSAVSALAKMGAVGRTLGYEIDNIVTSYNAALREWERLKAARVTDITRYVVARDAVNALADKHEQKTKEMAQHEREKQCLEDEIKEANRRIASLPDPEASCVVLPWRPQACRD